MPEGQTSCHLLIFDPGNPVDQTPRDSAVIHLGVFIKTDLGDLRDSRSTVCLIIFRPVSSVIPDIPEIIHMAGHVAETFCLQFMPGIYVRHTVIIRAELHKCFFTLAAGITSVISPAIRACQRRVFIHRLNRVIKTFPCILEISSVRRSFIDRNVNNGLINIDLRANIVFRILGCPVLLFPFSLPRHNRRTDILSQIIAVLLYRSRNAKHTIVIAVVHLDLLSAAFQKCFRHIQGVPVGMFRSHRTFRYKNLGFQRHDGVRCRHILAADAIQESSRAVNNLSGIGGRIQIHRQRSLRIRFRCFCCQPGKICRNNACRYHCGSHKFCSQTFCFPFQMCLFCHPCFQTFSHFDINLLIQYFFNFNTAQKQRKLYKSKKGGKN